MMSEYYDHYHRWEPLAEFHFNIGDEDDDDYDEDNYVYCLCSRAFIRDGVRTYYVDKEEGSESDAEVTHDSHSQDEHSHVHFSLDTSYKVKCEKDENASCYCSASHTDNYCSTDEHDPAQVQGTVSHALQPSDSGADLTYQDCHSDYTTHEKMEQDIPFEIITESDENYLSENTWEKFWAVNGERLIWASWIKNYSDYINPCYLDENNDLLMDDNNIPKQRSDDQIYKDSQFEVTKKIDEDDSIRERKFSYDSKVNPYKKNKTNPNPSEKISDNEMRNRDDHWFPLARKRSCSEHDRILSPRTVAGTDSMTNVTKITLSSYEVSSSHVTSESSPSDDYSMSSTTSDDQSNDKTRIANIDVNLEHPPSEEYDADQYWQLLWKKHFGEQYALHFANYVESHDEKPIEADVVDSSPVINIVNEPVTITKVGEKLEEGIEKSEGNSQDAQTIIEVQAQVDNIKLEDKITKPRKRNKKSVNRIIGSVGMLLQTLLKDEQKKNELCGLKEGSEVVEAGDGNDKMEPVATDVVDATATAINTQQTISSNTNFSPYSYDDGDEDPPEDKPVVIKRSHEIDEEAVAAENIKTTLELMGFCVNPDNLPKGQLIYKKRATRLQPPRHRRFGASRKTYFDDEGNPYQAQESNDEREIQTDDGSLEAKSDNEKASDVPNAKTTSTDESKTETVDDELEESKVTAEAASVPLPSDMSGSFSSVQENNDEQKAVESTKRRRRPKRQYRAVADHSEIPAELRDTPKMLKYWKKRHSLFHRFDEGIKLDLESWFSVTPESVARHIANKFAFDTVVDAFCGAGGNTIQFARTCKNVIAIDIDPVKISLARHNARVYGVEARVQFLEGDFFELAPQLEADMVFLSPPWGGPNYSKNEEYDLETMLEPRPASELMDVARNITTNIAIYLPRNTKSDQLISIAKDIGSSVEVEQSYLDKRYVAITAYFYQNNEL